MDYKNKVLTKKMLLKFEFRFINHVTRDLYEIVDARVWSKDVNAKTPHYISDKVIAFWMDECNGHAYVLQISDILPF